MQKQTKHYVPTVDFSCLSLSKTLGTLVAPLLHWGATLGCYIGVLHWGATLGCYSPQPLSPKLRRSLGLGI